MCARCLCLDIHEAAIRDAWVWILVWGLFFNLYLFRECLETTRSHSHEPFSHREYTILQQWKPSPAMPLFIYTEQHLASLHCIPVQIKIASPKRHDERARSSRKTWQSFTFSPGSDDTIWARFWPDRHVAVKRSLSDGWDGQTDLWSNLWSAVWDASRPRCRKSRVRISLSFSYMFLGIDQ